MIFVTETGPLSSAGSTVMLSRRAMVFRKVLFSVTRRTAASIWQRVKAIAGINADTIMLQPFPEFDAAKVDEAASADTEWLKQAIVAVRNIALKRKG